MVLEKNGYNADLSCYELTSDYHAKEFGTENKFVLDVLNLKKAKRHPLVNIKSYDFTKYEDNPNVRHTNIRGVYFYYPSK